MKNIFIICFLFFAINSYSQVHVKIHKLLNYSKEDSTRLDSVIKEMERVINDSAFKSEVLAMQITQDNNPDGFSNKRIYDLIMNADELYYANEKGVIDLKLQMKPTPFWKPWTKEVGYSTPSKEYIVTYHGKFKKFTKSGLAGHYIHEWIHKLGFDDSTKKTWDCSVTYAIQHIMEKLVND